MFRTLSLAPQRAAALCLGAAALALATAHAAELYGGLVPCALCLLERWPWRVAAVLGALALVLPSAPARAALALAALALLAGAGLAGLHVGVEQGWWPSPLPECAAPRLAGGSIAERLAALPARPSKPCDAPSYLVPGVALSMAALNGLASLGTAALVAISLARRHQGDPHERRPSSR